MAGRTVEQNLLIIRHSERCDNYYRKRGLTWYTKAFDESGNYTQFDKNLPVSLPRFEHDSQYFSRDSPITAFGYEMAMRAGECIRNAGFFVDHLYSSPSYRCMQTAQALRHGLNTDALICIEPHLYQWTQWCKGDVPTFPSVQQYADIGFTVDKSYVPNSVSTTLSSTESLEEFYVRSHCTMRHILQDCQNGTVLVVAHAASLETLTRRLCQLEPLRLRKFLKSIKKISYLKCVHLCKMSDAWHIQEVPPIPDLFITGFDVR